MLYFCVSNKLNRGPGSPVRQYRELVESGSGSLSAGAGRRVENKNLIQEIYSGPAFVCIFKTFCMINFLTKPSINDSWSVLLFDFQSDNFEFFSWNQEGKKEESYLQRALCLSITFLHRLSTKTDTKKENAS